MSAPGTLRPHPSTCGERSPVVHRELSVSDLSEAILLDRIGYEDSLGVLAVSVEMPADGADRRAEIEIKNKLERIVERALHTGARITPVDGSAADNLADSRDPGREPAGMGRGLVAGPRVACRADRLLLLTGRAESGWRVRTIAERASLFARLDRDTAAPGSGLEHGMQVGVEAGERSLRAG